MYAKCIYRTLRKLKKHSVVVADIIKTLMNLSSVDAVSTEKDLTASELSNLCRQITDFFFSPYNLDRAVELY